MGKYSTFLGLHPFDPATNRFIGWAHNHKAPNKGISYSERITARFFTIVIVPRDGPIVSLKMCYLSLPPFTTFSSDDDGFKVGPCTFVDDGYQERKSSHDGLIARKKDDMMSEYMCNSHERKMTRLTICGKNRIHIIILCLALPNVTFSCGVLSRYRAGQKPDPGFYLQAISLIGMV